MILTCTACAKEHDSALPQTVCGDCGQPLQADYHFSAGQLSRGRDLADIDSLWRYHAFLPPLAESERVTLGEGMTPLATAQLGGITVHLKDETGNPTGSFKDRGLCLAVTMARHFGFERVVLPSAGNAGVSAAAYARAGGIACRVYMPATIPASFVEEVRGYGAEVILAGSTIAEAGLAMAAELDSSWFNLSTLKEPYRVEGKKTLGLEIAEQLGWAAPDVVVYPAGGGTGLVGIYKALGELCDLGWIDTPLPRMVAVQMEGCAPVVKAFSAGAADIDPWPRPVTAALGLNVPSPLGGAWMLRTLRESGGTAVAIAESDLQGARLRLVAASGIKAGPEAAAAWRGTERLLDEGWIGPEDQVVIVITGDNSRY